MENEKIGIPKLRFPGYTDTWKQHKFEDLLDSKDGVRRGPFGSALKKEFFVENSEYVVYEQQNAIYDNYHTRYKITKEKFDELSKFKLNPGDFIMSGAGTIGRISRVPDGVKLGVFNQALIRFRINPEITDSEYFIQFVRADFMQKNLTGANPGSAITNLVPMSEVKKWEIKAPHLEEQEKIGSFFKLLDDTIALHQRKLDDLKKRKSGLLQKMFPRDGEDVPELRFPGFTEIWKKKRLGEVADIVGGGTPSTNNKEYWDGNIDWYSPVEINNQIYVSKSQNKITKLGLQKSSARILPVGTVLFTSRAGIGKTAILSKEGATNQGFQSIVPHKDILDSYFIFSQTNVLRHYGEVNGAGSTFVEVSGKQMSKMPIMVPKIEEQKVIGAFVEQLDKSITLHQRQLDHLKLRKKALLQQMFV